MRGADRLPAQIARLAELDPDRLRGDDGRASTTAAGASSRLRRRGRDAADPGGLGAAARRSHARRATDAASSGSRRPWARSRPSTSGTTTSATRSLAELQAKPTTRAEDILAGVPDYWAHYRSRPNATPGARPGALARRHPRARAGDRRDGRDVQRPGRGAPVNVPNPGGALPGLPRGLVVEMPGRCGAAGIEPLPHRRRCRATCAASWRCSAEYQAAGGRGGLERARGATPCARWAANPLVMRLDAAERLYDELAAAHRAHLPERLAARRWPALILGVDGGNTKTVALVAGARRHDRWAPAAAGAPTSTTPPRSAPRSARSAQPAPPRSMRPVHGRRRRGGVLQPGRRRLARGLRAAAGGAAGEDRASPASRRS